MKRIRMSMVATLTMVNFIVHEASPPLPATSNGLPHSGENLFDEIDQAVASLPKAGGDPFPAVPVRQRRRTRDDQRFYGMQAIHTRAHLLQAIYEGVVFSHMTHLEPDARTFY
ncbi:hypothetical protein ACLK19_24155 [Escherichia coli]